MAKVLIVRHLLGRSITNSNGVGEKIISCKEVDETTVRIEVSDANEAAVWMALTNCPNVTSIESNGWTTTASGRQLTQDGIPLVKSQETQARAVIFGVAVVVAAAAALGAMILFW